MSSRSAKHRKPKRAAARRPGAARHRKPSPIATALQNHPGKTAAAVTGAVMLAAAAPTASHWAGDLGFGQAAVLSHSGADSSLGLHTGTPSRSHNPRRSGTARSQHSSASGSSASRTAHTAGAKSTRQHHTAATAVYRNPLRAVTGLIPERIDQGVDFGGTGPIYALGDAVITGASATDFGWPGGGWITYRLTAGPAKGLSVFVAENVTPTVSAGQQVTSGSVIANMYNGGAGIETGWATADSSTAESQAPEAGGINGGGPFPTEVGMNFEELLQALGVPAGNNRGDTPYGLLPPNYPSDWPAALTSS